MGDELGGYLFPNDMHILWSLMIVLYPYVTGIVAGAFIVSSLYHVFGRNELRPVARLSMVASLCFLSVATLPLLMHLGHPERALNIVITPHFTSAMAAFGMIYTLYMILLLLEIWLVYRRQIVMTARQSRGIKRRIFSILSLGVYDISKESLHIDHRAVVVLAALGIPAACILHGYVGFMFGSVKANPYWSTPLMPIIFLFSAVTSGVAMINVLYQSLMKLSSKPIESNCVRSLSSWLWLFAIVTVTLELLEIISLAYEHSEEWLVIAPLLTDKLAFSFIGVQLIFGSLIPILLLAVVVLMDKYLTSPLRNTISFVASGILLIQVLSMRWNVVVGGQTYSKSMRGFREGYIPDMFGREGVLMGIVILLIPFALMGIFNHFLSLGPAEAEETASTGDAGSHATH